MFGQASHALHYCILIMHKVFSQLMEWRKEDNVCQITPGLDQALGFTVSYFELQVRNCLCWF